MQWSPNKPEYDCTKTEEEFLNSLGITKEQYYWTFSISTDSHFDLHLHAVPFDITLSHFTQRYTVFMYAVPFDITLSHFPQRYTICVYAVPF